MTGGECSVFAFLQHAHYCSAPPVFITRRCKGVKHELIWGPGVSLIDLWSDPAPVVQYRPHQWMVPWRKWIAPSCLCPFSNERERSVLWPSFFFSQNNSKVDLNSTYRGVNVACGHVLLHSASGVHVDLSQMERSGPGQASNLFGMDAVTYLPCLFSSKNWQLLLVSRSQWSYFRSSVSQSTLRSCTNTVKFTGPFSPTLLTRKRDEMFVFFLPEWP